MGQLLWTHLGMQPRVEGGTAALILVPGWPQGAELATREEKRVLMDLLQVMKQTTCISISEGVCATSALNQLQAFTQLRGPVSS